MLAFLSRYTVLEGYFMSAFSLLLKGETAMVTMVISTIFSDSHSPCLRGFVQMMTTLALLR